MAGALRSLLLLCLPAAVHAWSGLVEGFWWKPEDAVHGHSGAYTAEQRVQALEYLAAGGLDVYLYAPQTVDLLAPLDAGEQAEWKAAFGQADALGVRLVYGLRPPWLNATVTPWVTDKLAQLASLGCKAYALVFDDVPGGATKPQEALQVDLAATLQQLHPEMEAAFLPGSYSGEPKAQEKALATIDAGLDASVAMLLTGTVGVPHSVGLADFPALPSGRRIVFFDNWAAVDTSTRLPWGLGRFHGLPGELFAKSPAPVPPGAARFHCDAEAKQCVVAAAGHSTVANCTTACASPVAPDTARYHCDKGRCVVQATGHATAADCLTACGGDRANAWGYVLNLAFPLERVIHQLARLAQLRADPFGAPAANSSAAIAPAAQAWAGWLVQHGFVDAAAQDGVRAALDTAIAKDEFFGSVAELESTYPALKGVF